MTKNNAPSLILASSSTVRRTLLENAGVSFQVIPANVDEDAIKQSMFADNAKAIDAALVLANLKAVRVSNQTPDALVIGADQILDMDGVWFDKPPDMDHARSHLLKLRGRSHELATAVSIFRNGQQIWHHLESPELIMRDFSDEFLDRYLEETGDQLLNSVGAYQLERHGVQLFSTIEGDFFSILGLPLLAVLHFLRDHNLVQS